MTQLSRMFLYVFCFIFLLLNIAFAREDARVEMFSPLGVVKGVRQVSVRFSEQMVSLGDPRLIEPFEILCPEKGHARWADGKNWMYDFDRDVPAGVVCEFILRPDLKTLSGKSLTGQQQFSFSTGGPAIKGSYPNEGWNIDEDQVFILTLDAEPDEESVMANASCAIEGLNERIGVNILKGEDRQKILSAASSMLSDNKMPIVMLKCRQHFPENTKVGLIWGNGIKSMSGVSTTEDQILRFKSRMPFTASFHCQRENANADCIPVLPMYLNFTSPVSRELTKEIVMKGADNKVYKPSLNNDDENPEFVYSVTFNAPFPEKASFEISIPDNFKDDAGRMLANEDKFPLEVKTDSYPPLAKFSARFGIIELHGDATLPVTVRNLEPEITTRMLDVGNAEKGIIEKTKEGLLDSAVKIGESVSSILPGNKNDKGKTVVDGLKGRLQKIRMEREGSIIGWLRKVASAKREESILKREYGPKSFSVPKPAGSKEFEVIGIPLKEPGFYVVEMESEALGSVLLGKQKPMYVPTAALVTNLSAHFKWGKESSLVWVTTLDKAEPVKEVSISVTDCDGKLLWEGKTDGNGVAAIKTQLPDESNIPRCSSEVNYGESWQTLGGLNYGLFVFAKSGKDMTFVHSSWDKGIEQYRFNLPEISSPLNNVAHTIFDRTLLRAGETVHMKHIMRKHVMDGFSLVLNPELPKAVLIQHGGSYQKYTFPIVWDVNGIAETEWSIPKNAKLGEYEVYLLKNLPAKSATRTETGGYQEGDEGSFYPDGWNSGSFRVEEFRIPLMKGIIQPPKEPLVNVQNVDVDLMVSYLSGGGAINALVKLRSRIQPRSIHFDDYESFIFSNGEIKEGITRRADYEEAEEFQSRGKQEKIQTSDLTLDSTGSMRTKITSLPRVETPHDLSMELEFRDPNGEIQTVSKSVPLWNSKVIIGIKPDSWASSKESFKFHALVLDTSGKPVPGMRVKTELFQRKYYSHRKRLVGGFYSYEHVTEVNRIGSLCEGITDSKGLLICETQSPASGNVIIQVNTTDDVGNVSAANRDVWIAGKDEWWFDVSDSDRIDLLPEKKKYEPGETATFQVRMPFREATALITVEREGVINSSIQKLSGKTPVIKVPIKNNYAPNVFVSALVVRGRVTDYQPAAMVDLGKPAFKLGIAEINVGWKAHELKVKVSTDKPVYKIREKAHVKIKVTRADGNIPPKGSEVAVAAVDEGLLELKPNKSWEVLEAMMGRRGYEVKTSTAQMQVVGKRHYGLKALPQGGGGGRQITRELFDTLLLWKGRVPLNAKGEAEIDIPLNDSLTSFRIVAIANGGTGLFGKGQTSIRTTQDVMMFSGIPPLVREGDRFAASVTVRNSSTRAMDVDVAANVKGLHEKQLDKVSVFLSPGEAREISWDITVPSGIDTLNYEVTVKEKKGDARDSLSVKQKIVETVQVRTFQSTITRVENSAGITVEKPQDAIQGKGGVSVSLVPKLSDKLGAVTWYMKRYPYTCMEQKVSQAIALRDERLWKSVIAELPSYLDSDGLVKYFPKMLRGSDVLTSYIISIADEAGWTIPADLKNRMEDGLSGFINGKVIRYSSLPTADLSIRKVAAVEALSRGGKAYPVNLDSISIEPNLWPTSAVIDWMNILMRMKDLKGRDIKLKEAEQILRSRLNFQGTTMTFSTEQSDYLWWLMISADVNAVRSILALLNFDSWNEDMPRLVRGALSRQYRGIWNTTTANAWGVLAMEKFSKKFEPTSPAGKTSLSLNGVMRSVEWSNHSEGGNIMYDWPDRQEDLRISHNGTGTPWAIIQSLAAIPLKEPFTSGYKISKTIIPVEKKSKNKWSRGDVARVRLELEAQTDMTWVVVNDPIPAGSIVLGSGLGRDSRMLTEDEKKTGWVWPSFEERSFEGYRLYYEFVPKGKWTVDYTVRLNNDGVFNLPETRVEALYSPEMRGELPNDRMEIVK